MYVQIFKLTTSNFLDCLGLLKTVKAHENFTLKLIKNCLK